MKSQYHMLQQQEKLVLEKARYALMVLDVFIRQITKEALDRLQENLILVVRMPPANNTYLFQPLNLTVNGSATAFIKKISEWYSSEITKNP